MYSTGRTKTRPLDLGQKSVHAESVSRRRQHARQTVRLRLRVTETDRLRLRLISTSLRSPLTASTLMSPTRPLRPTGAGTGNSGQCDFKLIYLSLTRCSLGEGFTTIRYKCS